MKIKIFSVFAGFVLVIVFSVSLYGRAPSSTSSMRMSSGTERTPAIPLSPVRPPAPAPVLSGSGDRSAPPFEAPTHTPDISPPEDYSCPDGVTRLVIDSSIITRPDTAQSVLLGYLNDYTRYEYDGVYKLCFSISESDPIEFSTSGVTFTRSSDRSLPILISGLKLRTASAISLLTINADGVGVADSVLHGPGSGTAIVLNGQFNVVHGATIDGFETGIVANANFDKIEEATVHGSGSGTGVALQGQNDSIASSTVDHFNVGIAVRGENDSIGPEIEDVVEIHHNHIGIDAYKEVKFPYIKLNYTNEIAVKYDPSVGIEKPNYIKNEQTEGSAHCNERADGTKIYFMKFPNIPEGGKALIYNYTDGTSVIDCVIDADGKCPLSISEDLRKSTDKFWSIIDGPIFTFPFTDTFIFGDPQKCLSQSSVGTEVATIEIYTAGQYGNLETGTGTGTGSGDGDGGTTGTSGGIKTAGGPGGCGGGASIVPPSTSSGRTAMSTWLILWWLIFAAPVVLVAVRVRRKK